MSEGDPVIARRRSGQSGEARVNDTRVQSQYQPYKDAEWGFINHWYPALFSKELGEDEVEGIQICGIPIVLRRVDGKVYALKDQCPHRGVRLSAKPMCFTKDTISCWYHGFTFNLDDGKLATILANPDDPLIGRTGVTSYPVHEVAGLIFVFVRDDDFSLEDVPPLEEDLPVRYPANSERFPHPLWPASPSVLDENAVCLGIHRTGYTNWRIAVENGMDNAHILVHKDNSIVHALGWQLPLGILPADDDAIALVEDEGGPKGMVQWLCTDKWEPVLENKRLGVAVAGVNARPYRTSCVLPGIIMVENWPEEHCVQYEWFVPITNDTHEYWEVLVKICPTEEDRKAYEYRYKTFYEPLALHGFNDCDIAAREAQEDFYADGTGWGAEQLVSTDISPITWRKVASRWNRGIAKPGKGVEGVNPASAIRMSRTSKGTPPGYKVVKVEE